MAGETYWMERIWAGRILARESGECLERAPRLGDGNESNPLSDGSLLIVRPGGFGDLLFLTPVIRALKARNPRRRIGLACAEWYRDVLATFDSLDALVPYPLPVAEAERWDSIAWLEDSVERSEEARSLHIADLFARLLGVSWRTGESRACEYEPEMIELEEATKWRRERVDIPRDRWLVAVQARSSGACRKYPHNQELVSRLLHDNHAVLILGEPMAPGREIPPEMRYSNLHDARFERWTFRRQAAALTVCDAVIAPDSAWCHIGGALGVPTIGLYGPFPAKLRTIYHPSVEAMEAREGCPMRPCFHHERERDGKYPEGGPCATPRWRRGLPPGQSEQYCHALASIEPEKVLRRLSKIILEKK